MLLFKTACWGVGLAVAMAGGWLLHNHVESSGLRMVLEMVLVSIIVAICGGINWIATQVATQDGTRDDDGHNL